MAVSQVDMNETEKLTELRYALIIEIGLPCLFFWSLEFRIILSIHVADVVGNVAAFKLLCIYLTSNTFTASGDFCFLSLTFAKSLDQDQARQNVGPDLDLNCLTLMVFLQMFLIYN